MCIPKLCDGQDISIIQHCASMSHSTRFSHSELGKATVSSFATSLNSFSFSNQLLLCIYLTPPASSPPTLPHATCFSTSALHSSPPSMPSFCTSCHLLLPLHHPSLAFSLPTYIACLSFPLSPVCLSVCIYLVVYTVNPRLSETG